MITAIVALAVSGQFDLESYRASTKALGAEAAFVQYVHCREQDLPTLRMVVGSFTSTADLSAATPRKVGRDLYLLDLRGLDWLRLPRLLADSYPYRTTPGSKGKTRPAVIDARWFCQWITDQTLSKQAQNLLIFGKEVETEKQLFELVGANRKFEMVWLEDNSGVAVQKIRRFHGAPTSGFDTVWFTRDFRKVNQGNDPLENLLKEDDIKHDASEVIFALSKIDPRTGDRSLAMGFGLFNGEGKVQFEAPADIVVTDDNRGPILRSSYSCTHCHTRGGGLLPGSVHSLSNYIGKGGLVDVENAKIKAQIQARYLAKLTRDIEQFNAGFAAFVTSTHGGTPAEAAQSLSQLVAEYDAALSLDEAAAELFIDPKKLEQIIRRRQIDLNLPARVTALVRGVPIPRETFEQHWTNMYVMIKTTK